MLFRASIDKDLPYNNAAIARGWLSQGFNMKRRALFMAPRLAVRMKALCRSEIGTRVIWIAALWLGMHTVHAAEPKADPAVARGERLAQMICSACHIVAPNQEFTPILQTPPPSFAEIASRPTTTERSIIDFLKSTHWDGKTIPLTMPDPMLMANQRMDLAHYILSMRPKSPK